MKESAARARLSGQVAVHGRGHDALLGLLARDVVDRVDAVRVVRQCLRARQKVPFVGVVGRCAAGERVRLMQNRSRFGLGEPRCARGRTMLRCTRSLIFVVWAPSLVMMPGKNPARELAT